MGSTGSGNFSDYPGSSNGKGSAGGRDDGVQADRCSRGFSVKLEDVDLSDYYVTHSAAPSKGTTLAIKLRKRLCAVTLDDMSVGNLPTSMNYLAACLKDNFSYTGIIQSIEKTDAGTIIMADFIVG